MSRDARLLELSVLDQLERVPGKDFGPYLNDGPERRLVVHLLAEAYVNDTAHAHFPEDKHVMQAEVNFLKRKIEQEQWEAIRDVISGRRPVRLSINHRGAVRRAELEQALKSNRIKETFGLIWDGRHLRQDLRIALLDAAPDRPLMLLYIDLNDVKTFNAVSHATGDDALRRYLEVIADVCGDRDAYRKSGGADEVVVLLPRTEQAAALDLARAVSRALGQQQVAGHSLRAAFGLVVATSVAADPDDVVHRADLEQIRAKQESKQHAHRPSVLAFGGDQLEPL